MSAKIEIYVGDIGFEEGIKIAQKIQARLEKEYCGLVNHLDGGLSVDEVVGLMRYIPREDVRTQTQRYKDELDLLGKVREELRRKLMGWQYGIAEDVLNIMELERRMKIRSLG